MPLEVLFATHTDHSKYTTCIDNNLFASSQTEHMHKCNTQKRASFI